MAFRFRLQSVLKLRESLKSDRQQELAQVIQADQMLNQQREQLLNEIRETENEIRQSQQTAINVDSLIAMRRYLTDTKLTIRQIDLQQEQLAQEIERRQMRLAEANQQVQIMEKLKESQKTAFQKNLLAQEQMQLDEFRQPKRTPFGD